MTLPRLLILIAIMLGLFIGGFMRLPFWPTVGLGTLSFMAALMVRPVAELRRGMKGFNKKVLRRKRADLRAILVATGGVLSVFLLVPALTFGAGFILSAIFKGIG